MTHTHSRLVLQRLALRWCTLLCAVSAVAPLSAREMNLDRSGTQWAPFLEWEVPNPSSERNPFDLPATVTFVHAGSGERRTTGMFYDGRNIWKFRFTATRPGRWGFSTSSADPDLDGHKGTVTIRPNPQAYGFVTHVGNKWARPVGEAGALEAFVPQFVMYDGPHRFHNKPERIDAHIKAALVEHGFTGFHVPVLSRWFDLEQEQSSGIKGDDPKPDPRTFEALELLITRTHAAGGVVHLWAWGDQQRQQTPVRWGINGKADKRLQRYIAARLGPLPGWTMGYGFDLWEWVSGEQLAEWHRHMHSLSGWPHMLGARASTNRLDQLTEVLDYSSYEQHRPDYEMYVKTLERRSGKPSFSEDRFRIRQSPYPEKDYDMHRTRRGLWHSAMAGGVANIWGYLLGGGDGPALPYPDPHAIRTYSQFFRNRFLTDLTRDNELTDGACLRTPDFKQFLFYKEDADSLHLDLTRMPGKRRAIAVDARKPYREIDLGSLDPRRHEWKAPDRSDWAIAVGEFPAARGGKQDRSLTHRSGKAVRPREGGRRWYALAGNTVGVAESSVSRSKKGARMSRLKVSENRRFLVKEDGKPFFYLGDTAWELFHRLNREEAERYLRNRAEKGFTVIQAVVLAELNGLHDPNPYGHVPLKDDDPTQPNEEYFKHVDWIVNKAEELGLHIGMLPTWGDKWNEGRSAGSAVFTPQNAGAYGEWLGRRYRDRAIIWILGGDRRVETDQHRAILEAMARGLRKGDGGAHLMTLHPPGGAGSSQWFHEADWLDFNMRQNGHVTEFTGRYDATRADYDRKPVKPVIDGEPIYEDHPVSFNANNLGHSVAADVRRPLYWNLFSGAFGHTYGHHSVWQMWQPGRSPINNPLMPWYEAIDQPGAGQMQFGRRLIESRPFLTRIPDDSIIVTGRVPTSVPGAGRYRFVATRDEGGTYAMVYAPVGRSFSVRMDAITGRTVKAWWFNPRSGKAQAIGEFPNTGAREFTPPDRGELLDWVLVLDDASRRYPPPGQATRS